MLDTLTARYKISPTELLGVNENAGGQFVDINLLHDN